MLTECRSATVLAHPLVLAVLLAKTTPAAVLAQRLLLAMLTGGSWAAIFAVALLLAVLADASSTAVLAIISRLPVLTAATFDRLRAFLANWLHLAVLTEAFSSALPTEVPVLLVFADNSPATIFALDPVHIMLAVGESFAVLTGTSSLAVIADR